MINKHLGVKIGLTAVLTAAGLQVFQSMGEDGVFCSSDRHLLDQLGTGNVRNAHTLMKAKTPYLQVPFSLDINTIFLVMVTAGDWAVPHDEKHARREWLRSCRGEWGSRDCSTVASQVRLVHCCC